MAIVVPGKCWCTAAYWTQMSTNYGVLGPFAEGDYIRRISVMATGVVANHGRFSASLGRSGEATAESHRAGVPLIQRSTYYVNGVPQLLWSHQSEGEFFMYVPVGIGGDVGSRYVVFVVVPAGAELSGCMVVGAEVLRIEREPRGMKPT